MSWTAVNERKRRHTAGNKRAADDRRERDALLSAKDAMPALRCRCERPQPYEDLSEWRCLKCGKSIQQTTNGRNNGISNTRRAAAR